ncbi:p-loop containing nucleoside triphosphate hydrolase [Fusarium longipes]|uniref:p-loop containing nucleoside triphosphate hydrolase n=1 Tax=Fusarium longipes TaxID=694270 RepID=A0A395SSB0_9HYPO|nr:p-loop containing nucleoside triphosphate hydrolase [Fusarium longipes]
MSPPPPPPMPISRHRPLTSEPQDTPVDFQPFVVKNDNSGENAQFVFSKASTNSGTVSLRTIVTQYLGTPHASTASADQLFQILGRLRCLQYALKNYNSRLQDPSVGFLKYWRKHALDLLTGFGFNPGQQHEVICISGLDDLISRIENIYASDIQEYKSLMSNGMTSFEGLIELFRPDIPVKAQLLPGGTYCVFRVTDAFFQERRNSFGARSKNLHVTLETVVAVGDHFSVASFTEIMSSWTGTQPRSLSDMTYRPILESDRDVLLHSARKAVHYGKSGTNYVAYASNSFILHSTRTRNKSSMSQPTHNSISPTGGRMMIDMARSASLGYHPCQGVDEATLAIIQLSSRYRQWLSRRDRSDSLDDGSLYLWDDVPDDFLIFCWPALVGFSFTAKTWGFVLADGLSNINFHNQAFDKLVLSQERKQIIRAVVRCGTSEEVRAQDLISTKQGGLIFLLHGPPGVGKTLTAEAVAELLHRPLYYVTMGELGVTPEDLESKLSDILNLCAEWDALAVLDEADVFLETRTTSDLVRNAMVCVMLRMLEYHPGILFLTTNRVRSLDPAFESRITLSIRYEALDPSAREQIWKNQLNSHARVDVQTVDYKELAKQKLNGRQIKNVVRVALSLAMDQEVMVTQQILLKTIEITALGHRNMKEDSTWESPIQ